jgi:hypothetical protein
VAGVQARAAWAGHAGKSIRDGAVSRAAAAIERDIAADPEKVGVEFYGDRLYVIQPISAVYEILAPDRLVRVLDVFYRGPEREP